MAQTFAEHLAQVAHSIDIVDNEILARFKRLIARYDRETLNIRHVLLLIQEPADHGSGLTIVALESDTPGRTQHVRDAEGLYRGQMGLAYERRKPLWIVAAGAKKPLVATREYRDLWSGARRIPPYVAPEGIDPTEEDLEPIRTSILMPLRERGQVRGVLNFETPEYLDITEVAKAELAGIARLLPQLWRLSRVYDTQRRSTFAAL